MGDAYVATLLTPVMQSALVFEAWGAGVLQLHLHVLGFSEVFCSCIIVSSSCDGE